MIAALILMAGPTMVNLNIPVGEFTVPATAFGCSSAKDSKEPYTGFFIVKIVHDRSVSSIQVSRYQSGESERWAFDNAIKSVLFNGDTDEGTWLVKAGDIVDGRNVEFEILLRGGDKVSATADRMIVRKAGVEYRNGFCMVMPPMPGFNQAKSP